jgi:hypothetical protein
MVDTQTQKKANWWKRGILIVGGVLVLGFGGCSTVAVLALGSAANSVGEAGDPNGSQAVKTYDVGEAAKVSGASWTVTKAYETERIVDPSGFDKPQRGHFVVVNFKFTNTGKEAVTLDSTHATIKDSKGRSSEHDPDAQMAVPMSKDLFLDNVNPGVTQEGAVVFSVAPKAEDFEFHGADMDMMSDESNDARIDLGF